MIRKMDYGNDHAVLFRPAPEYFDISFEIAFQMK